jgi:threonine/homoserine/homoserine lactone efflux protein
MSGRALRGNPYTAAGLWQPGEVRACARFTPRFLAFLPQFVAANEGHPLLRMLELSGAFMAMTFAVFLLYGLFAASVRDRIVTRPKAMTWLRRAFAGGFAALGARLAFAER